MGDEKGIDIDARLRSSMPSGTPEAFQATPLTLEELCRLSSDIKRGTFTKKQLSIVIKKMLKMEDAE